MNKNNYAIIMAGGIGTRFWPMSRKKCPKQFLDILGNGETLIQQTFRRLKKVCVAENILVVTNDDYKGICKEQLPEIKVSNILCEPVMRNTAPCVAYAAFKIYQQNKEANMIIAPSDHLITQEDEFTRVVNECLLASAKEDCLITLGIKASRPDTGYGYIQHNPTPLESNSSLIKVKTFTEKPNQELALQFIDSGDFLWNAGIFIWKAENIILSFRKHLRDLYDIFEAGIKYYNTEDEKAFIERIFAGCKNISIDYGIMEKSENVYVFPADFGWSDLGTWGSLHNHLDKDEHNNGIIGDNVVSYNSSGNIINVPEGKLVIIQGLNGYIVVENNDALLICKKEDEQQIKTIVNNLKKH